MDYDYTKGAICLTRVNQVAAQVGIVITKDGGGAFDVPTASTTT